MRQLDRYIGRTVVLSILLTLLVLLILIAFVSLLDEADEVGNGSYQSWDALKYVLLVLPRVGYEIFPIAVLLGSLVGMGGLASHSELIAMRAAGVSLPRLIFSALKAGVLFMVIVVLVGEFVAPGSEQLGERMRAEKLAKQITLNTKYGFWARDRDAIINIRYILTNSRLKDIYIYQFLGNRELRVATHAAFAEYQGANNWLLQDIRISRFTPDGVVSSQKETEIWPSSLDPELLDIVVRPSLLPAWSLYQFVQFLQENGQEATKYELAFWGKIITPFTTIIMVFLSVPVVFGMLRTVGIGQRIFFGGLLGITFLMLNKAFANLAMIYHLNPLFAASFPTLVLLCAGIWFARRQR